MAECSFLQAIKQEGHNPLTFRFFEDSEAPSGVCTEFVCLPMLFCLLHLSSLSALVYLVKLSVYFLFS